MKVKLLKNHRHAGVDFTAGKEIDVDESTADWLANLKVATPSGAVSATPVKRGQASQNQAVVVPEVVRQVESAPLPKGDSGTTPAED